MSPPLISSMVSEFAADADASEGAACLVSQHGQWRQHAVACAGASRDLLLSSYGLVHL